MGTNYIAPIWRMPRNANNTPVDKLSNYSMEFDGGTSSQAINCGDSDNVDITGPISISVWFNTNDFSSSRGIVCKNDNNASKLYAQYFLEILNATLRWRAGRIDVSYPIQKDQWYHAVGTYDGSNITLYVNGSQVATASASSTSYQSNQPMYIGRRLAQSYFGGKIAQVCIFDYALTDGTGGTTNQIEYLYNLNNPMAITGGEPVAYWPLGDNSNPNANVGYPNISTGTDSVFLFSGTQVIDVPDSDSLSFGDNVDDSPFTMSAWIKSSNSSGRGIMSKFASTGHEWLLWTVGSGAAKVRMNLYDGGATVYQTTQGSSTVDTGEWVHVVATYDGGGGSTAGQGIKIYVNGEEDTPYTYLNNGAYDSMHNTTTQVQIGDYGNNSGGWNGEMSNAQIWGRVLTEPEVKTLYNNGQPLMTGTQPQEADLKAWWKLNQSANWEADTTGNWQIPDATSAYPRSFKFSDNLEAVYSPNDLGMDRTKVRCVSFWYKNDQQSQYGYVINCRSTSQGAGFAFICRNNSGVDSGYVFSTRYTGGSTGYIATGYVGTLKIPRDGNWHHVAFTHSETDQLKVYIDGVYKYQKVSTGPSDGADPIRLRFGGPGSTQDINGVLSNMMIWEDVTLTDGGVALNDVAGGEIAQLYNNGKPLTSTIQSDKLLAWYKFDDTEKFDGTNWSVENQKYPANWESALSFETQQYVEKVVTGQSPLGISGAITFSGWFKTSETTGYGNIICEDSFGQATKRNWVLLRRNNAIRAGLYPVDGSGGTTAILESTNVIAGDGKWHFALATWDGTTNVNAFKLFIDGALSAQGTTDFTVLQTGAAPLSVSDNTVSYDFIGELSNVQVWDKSLTYGSATSVGDIAGGQVGQLYNNGTPLLTALESPVLWWKLDNTTTGIQDSGSSGNNGTNNGATKVNTFVSTEALYSEDLPEQALVNNNVSVLNGDSDGMTTTALVQSNLTRKQPFSNYSMFYDAVDVYSTFDTQISLGSSDSFTWSFWIKPVYNSISDMVLVRASATSITANNTILLTYSGGNWRIKWDNANGNFQTGYVMPNNEWSHVALSIPQGTSPIRLRKAYINGVEVTSNNSVTGITSQWLGFSSENTTNDFEGYLSQCAYWDTNLSTTELAALYNNGVPQDLRNFSVQPTQYWPMNQEYSYWDGSVWINRDIISDNDSTAVNTAVVSAFVGNAPGSDANGTGSNLAIADLKGNMYNSDKNVYSINMADYADGVTNPANSGRSTDTP